MDGRGPTVVADPPRGHLHAAHEPHAGARERPGSFGPALDGVVIRDAHGAEAFTLGGLHEPSRAIGAV